LAVDGAREENVVVAVVVARRYGRVAHDAELDAIDVVVPGRERVFGRRIPARSTIDQGTRRSELQVHHDRSVHPAIVQEDVGVGARTAGAEQDEARREARHGRRPPVAACRATSATTADSNAASDIAGFAESSGSAVAARKPPTSRSGLPSN